jgi:hypothetical protein
LSVSRFPVVTIHSVTYRGTAFEAPVSIAADYAVSHGNIVRASTSVPYSRFGGIDDESAIVVEYTAGADKDKIADDILAALRLELGYLYANRGDETDRDKVRDPSQAVMNLIGPYRRLGA